ncbi:MAG: hypothetical protein K2W94_02185 [Alphaproteobacteria bacterium]|nr:hypothetical protein [Alphaproteobacteria bacterium]
MKINKFVIIIASLSMMCAAYAMEDQQRGNQNSRLPLARAGNSGNIAITAEEAQRLISGDNVPKATIGGGFFHSLGLGSAPKEYVEIGAAAAMVVSYMAQKLGSVGQELSETERELRGTAANLSQTSSQLERAAGVQRALEEKQRKTDELQIIINNLRLEKEAAELAKKRVLEERTALLTANEGAEADKLLQQMRLRDLEKRVKEKDRIADQLEKARQDKRVLEEERKSLQDLLAHKLGSDTPRDGTVFTQLEALIAQKEEQERKELDKLQGLIREKEEKEALLTEQIKRLEREKEEKEALIEQYKISVHFGDPYDYLVGLINSQMPDDQLRLELLATMTRLKKTLDALWEDKCESLRRSGASEMPKSLVSIMIRVSRPTDVAYRRAGKVFGNTPGDRYENRKRVIGNDFVELGWGSTIDPDSYRYTGSGLEKNMNNAADMFKKQTAGSKVLRK